MPSTSDLDKQIFFDAGLFIGALLDGDPLHLKARPLVDAGRRGEMRAVTSSGVLCEVYAALTWEQAMPRHGPEEAAEAVRLLVEPPSLIQVLDSGLTTILLALELAAQYKLRARRTHDAQHAAVAIVHGISSIHTYDVDDWRIFQGRGLQITGPPSVMHRVQAAQGN